VLAKGQALPSIASARSSICRENEYVYSFGASTATRRKLMLLVPFKSNKIDKPMSLGHK